MDKEVLSAWILGEVEKISLRQLARSLETSATTLAALRDKERGDINDDLLRAIAFRRKESLAKTAEWLGLEVPDSYDWPARFAAIEARLRDMERKVEYSYQRATDSDAKDPSLTLDSYLLERGVNVRNAAEQRKIKEIVATIAPKSAVAFERFLLVCLGIVEPSGDDAKVIAKILRKLSEDPWTAAEVERVIREGRAAEKL